MAVNNSQAYFVGSFNADVIKPAIGLEWLGFLDAIMCAPRTDPALQTTARFTASCR